MQEASHVGESSLEDEFKALHLSTRANTECVGELLVAHSLGTHAGWIDFPADLA